MAARKTTVSMKDVAALAGVSLGTVSNVLNSPGFGCGANATPGRSRDRKARLDSE